MARKVQTDQALEYHAICRLRTGQEDEEAGCRAAICDHIEHSAKPGGLLELARGPAVQSIEEGGDGVKEAASARVYGHEVEGCGGEDDSCVACRQYAVSMEHARLRWCSSYR